MTSRPAPLSNAAARCSYCVGQREDWLPGHRAQLFDITEYEMASCQTFSGPVIALFHAEFDALPTHELAVLKKFAASTHHKWHALNNTTCHTMP